MEVDRETKEDMGEKRKREEEKEVNEKVIVKRRCVIPVSTEAFDIFSQVEDSESCGNSCGDLRDESCGLSDWTGVLVVTCVLVCPSSAVAEMCEGVSSDSDWEFVEPQSFSFSNSVKPKGEKDRSDTFAAMPRKGGVRNRETVPAEDHVD